MGSFFFWGNEWNLFPQKKNRQAKKTELKLLATSGYLGLSPSPTELQDISYPECRTGLRSHVLNIKSDKSPPNTWVHTQKTLLHMLQHSFGHGTQWVATFQIQWTNELSFKRTPWLSTLLCYFNSHFGKHYLICATNRDLPGTTCLKWELLLGERKKKN